MKTTEVIVTFITTTVSPPVLSVLTNPTCRAHRKDKLKGWEAGDALEGKGRGEGGRGFNN